MSATASPTSRPGHPLDRLFDWLLDRRGDIYGDERERTNWYEAISVVASFQWLLLPWSLAALVWFAGPPTVWFLVAVFVVFYLPMPLAQLYIARKGVRQLPDRTGVKYWTVFTLGALPYPVFLAGVIAALTGYGGDPVIWWSALVGGVIGGTVGLLLLLRSRQRRRRGELGSDDLD